MVFLKKIAAELKLQFKVVYPSDKEKPTVVLTLHGSNPELPSIMLNSHMDVVPVFEEFWSHNPFSAEIDELGRIFARGTQDMKCKHVKVYVNLFSNIISFIAVGMQYLGAVRSLQKDQIKLKRTIHVTFVPDEEIFGADGTKAFVNSDDFRELNVGFLLDEGIASENEIFKVFYGERTCWRKT